ncbi:MAG: type II secretion system F family protein [Candidatus Bathyarchaeia archaeon]
MPKVQVWEKKVAWCVSATLGVAILVTAYLTMWGKPLFDEYVLLAVIIVIFPPAVLDYLDFRWKRAVDEHLPDLFRTVVQAQETGMTLPQALEEASKRRYGPLTEELRRMVAQMSWGMAFEEALKSFGKRVNTLLVRRTIPLIIEASHSGGHVEKIFEPMGSFIQSTLTLNKERQAQTRPYIAIIYVAFFVFLFTIILLFKTFFIQTQDTPVLGMALLSPEQTKRLFFHMSAIQAFFGGLVAGKMGEGTVSAGLKHAVLLMACGYLALKFFV